MPKSHPKLCSSKVTHPFERHLKRKHKAKFMRNGDVVSKKSSMSFEEMGNSGKLSYFGLMIYSSEKSELPDSISSQIIIDIFLAPFLTSRLMAGRSSSEHLDSLGSETRSSLLLI